MKSCLFLVLMVGTGIAVMADEIPDPAALPDDILARIGVVDLPYDWFLHEFRSTFFRHAGEPDVREAVLEGFLDKMTLYAAARQSGVGEDPELRERIDQRLADQQAFLEYQLAMTEVTMLVQAFLEAEGLAPESFTVTDEDVADYLDRQETPLPAAMRDRDGNLQPHVRERLEQAVRAERQRAAVDALLAERAESLPVQVNRDRVQEVPLPEMKGTPPPGLKGFPAGAVYRSE